MNIYYMTFYRPSDINHWLLCESVNFSSAKREAYIHYKDNYTDGVILLSKIDEIGQRYVVASRKSVSTARWQNYWTKPIQRF